MRSLGAQVVTLVTLVTLSALSGGALAQRGRRSRTRGRDPKVVSFERFMLKNPNAPKMFGFSVQGAYWMEQRARKASSKLGRAIGGLRRSKRRDRPVVFGKGVLFGDAIFRDSFFNSQQRSNGRSVKRWHKEQPWLKWDEASKSFTFKNEGATQHLLAKLGDRVTVHRGASALEASFWRGVKQYYSGKLSASEAQALKATLRSVAERWELKPASAARLARMTNKGFGGRLPKKATRRKTALFLLDLIAQRTEDGTGYGTISATPSERAARGWAKGTEKGKIWGRQQQQAEVLSFNLDLAKAPREARTGLYAGVENGAFLKLPAYVEVAFVTPEAKLYALERLEGKPGTP